MTVLHAGGKFDDDSYKVSGGLHGVGVSVVNALSELLVLTIHRGRQALPAEVPARRAPGAAGRRGDDRQARHDDPLQAKLQDLHEHRVRLRHAGQAPARAVVPELRRAHRVDRRARGQAGRLRVRGRHPRVRAISQSQQDAGPSDHHLVSRHSRMPIQVEVACNGTTPTRRACSATRTTSRSGTAAPTWPASAAALTRTLNDYIEKQFAQATRSPTSGDDAREGLTAVLSVKMPDPKFSSQTKDKLVSSEIKGIVESVVGAKLEEFLLEHPSQAKAIAARSSRPRERAKLHARLAR